MKAYRRRHTIENCIGWLKECRRIATRFEKTAVNFLAMLKLACIERYLRFQFSSTAQFLTTSLARQSVPALNRIQYGPGGRGFEAPSIPSHRY